MNNTNNEEDKLDEILKELDIAMYDDNGWLRDLDDILEDLEEQLYRGGIKC